MTEPRKKIFEPTGTLCALMQAERKKLLNDIFFLFHRISDYRSTLEELELLGADKEGMKIVCYHETAEKAVNEILDSIKEIFEDTQSNTTKNIIDLHFPKL